MGLGLRCHKILFAVLSLLTLAHTAAGAGYSQDTYSLYRNSTKPVLDGVMDEPMWQQSTLIELNYENEPGQGIPASVKTLAYLYQDGTSLHIGIIAFDPDPSAIRASLREHDNIWKDDNVGIIIDTFDDQRSGFGFFVNPLGAQADMTKQETDDADETEDYSWNAIWGSAGQINDAGYVVEMSIPFRALRFPDGGGELSWNIAVHRNYLRENWVEIANFRKDRNRKCSICQYETLRGFENISAGKNIQLTPTFTMGRTDLKESVNNGSNNTSWQQGDFENELGADLRWGITQNLVLNATLNPDFSQVETDAAQLDINNTYALYYAEKRPFFLDGADYFTTPLFSFVHTRNIADPDYGGKLTGKTDSHRYGVMVANDNRTDFLIPGNQGSDLAETGLKSTATIARYRMDIGKQSNVGLLITNRSADNYNNQLFSLDGVYWLNDSSSVAYQWAHSDTLNPVQIQDDFGLEENQSGQAGRISFNHRTRNFELFADLQRIDVGFRADLGFLDRVNYQSINLGSSRTWFTDRQGWLTQFSITGDWGKTWDLDNMLLDEGWEVHGELNGKLQSTLDLGIIQNESLYAGRYYEEQQVTFWGKFTPVGSVEVSIFIRFGDQIDYTNKQLGERFKVASAINWQINQHLQIEAEYDYSYLNVNGGELYRASVTDAKFIWQFNRRSQLRFIVQYTDVERDVELYNNPEFFDSREKYFTSQLLYSYKINPQTLIFLGYSDSGFQDDELEHLTRTEKTLFAKFSYAWQR